MCNGGLFLFCVTVTQKTENAKFTGKELTKQIFPDILIKVGLKSHEKSEKTRYYFVLLSEQEKKFRIITINEQIQNIAQKKDTLCRRMYN